MKIYFILPAEERLFIKYTGQIAVVEKISNTEFSYRSIKEIKKIASEKALLCHQKSKEESPNCTRLRFGDFVLCPYGTFASLFAEWHYSICKKFFSIIRVLISFVSYFSISAFAFMETEKIGIIS